MRNGFVAEPGTDQGAPTRDKLAGIKASQLELLGAQVKFTEARGKLPKM